MAKIVSIVGATGAQGKGVIAAFKGNPAYHIRAITRNPASESGKALASEGIEVVRADVNDVESLKSAFAGSHIIFAVTNFFEPFATGGPEKGMEVEIQQGKNLAAAAAATSTLEHYIWSTLPNAKAVSGGKYIVPHFQGKNVIDAYIRADAALLKKTTFFWVTFYHSNFAFPMFTPYWIPSAGKYVQFANYAPDTPISTIGDVTLNVAPFIRAVVEQPQKSANGAIVLAEVGSYGADEYLQKWAVAKGHKAQFVRVSSKDFGNLWPMWADEMGVMMQFWDEYREKSWTDPDQKVLTAEDLGVTGLQSLDDGFKALEI